MLILLRAILVNEISQYLKKEIKWELMEKRFRLIMV